MLRIYDDILFQSLRKIAPKANITVLQCTNQACTDNFSKNTTTWEVDKDNDWLMRLTCSRCKSQWAICNACNKFKVMMKSKTQINMHRNTHHSSKAKLKRSNEDDILLDQDNSSNTNKKQKLMVS
jgi:hypothetical protein